MLELNGRIKFARKELGLNQLEFGKRVGVTDGAISFIEKGKRKVTDQMILAVCREYGISEAWLRTGEGHMLTEPARAAVEAATGGLAPDDPLRRLVEMYAQLPEKNRAVIAGFARKWASDVAGYDPAEPESAQLTPEEIAEAEALAGEAARLAREQYIREKTLASRTSTSGGSETA